MNNKEIIEKELENYKKEELLENYKKEELKEISDLVDALTNTYLGDEDLILEPGFIEECELVLTNARKFFTNLSINFLIGKTRRRKQGEEESSTETFLKGGELKDSISNLIITSKAIRAKNYSSKAFSIPSVNTLLKEIKDIEIQKEQLIDLLLIRNRVIGLQNYYLTTGDNDIFYTYYFSKKENTPYSQEISKENKLKKVQSWGDKGKTEEKISQRYLRWISNNNTNTFVTGIVKNHQIETNDEYVLYAYDKESKKISGIGGNAGILFEGLVQAASSIPYNIYEFSYWKKVSEEIINNNKSSLSLSKIKYKDLNFVKTAMWNLDQAMIRAHNNTELFRGGDANFILYREKGDGEIELVLKSYQVKGTNATEKGTTIITGILLLNDFLNNRNYTTERRNTIQKKNRISENKNLKDIFLEDIDNAILKAEPELINIIYKNVPEAVKKYILQRNAKT